MNTNTVFLRRVFITLTLALAAMPDRDSVAAEQTPRPNIVLIMSDDLGFSDIGCYGSEIATPNIDALAHGGLRFSQFYNAGRCCPTRAALLTGLYSHQAGIGHMLSNRGVPGYQGNLSNSCVTIAEVLKAAGYSTLMVGKWHVANRRDTWPNQRGFDRYYGTPSGGGVFFKDNFVTRPGVTFTLDGQPTAIPDDWYVTDALTDYAIRFVDEAAQQDRPFFLYLAHLAPHWPLQAKKSDVDKYRGRYDVGWDAIRENRYSRLSGAIYPQLARGTPVVPPEGVSLQPAFQDAPIRRDAPLFWEHEGNRAVRDGKWKLVARHQGDWELYDLETDRTEVNNLAAKQHDKVTELAGRYEQWANRVHVLPWDQVQQK